MLTDARGDLGGRGGLVLARTWWSRRQWHQLSIVVGSVRPGRYSRAVAEWVLATAKDRDDAEFELVDPADHPLPHLDEPVPASASRYTNAHTKA
ncbi:hypothetical protein Psuf_066520 [Phytohabitans suffuscus]|uniref:NADPH-dependent FMN reductase-like domain-containing protein n=1 Tax=Phytohabitans suffuscus TaxID=624315 RepID=A0A6F8YTE7_9ACTN|nr:hypothetical protein Psuf_066520 [Phytohabitans suffuscus]